MQTREGRWEIITADFDNKPIKAFTMDTVYEPLHLLATP
jgi:hypothetical protein